MSDHHYRPRSMSRRSSERLEPTQESASSAELDALIAPALADGVEPLLALANDIAAACPDCAANAVRSTFPDDSRERRALVVALSVLLGIEVPAPLRKGLPDWLVTLPEATVCSVRRRRNGTSWTLLIEVGTPAQCVVSAQVVLDGAGVLTSGFVIDESIGQLDQLIRSIGRDRGRSFSVVQPSTVAPDLLAGFGRRQLRRFEWMDDMCRPDNEALITWVVRLVVDAGQARPRSA